MDTNDTAAPETVKPPASFLIVDLETTGLSPWSDRILEVGYLVVTSDLQILAGGSRVFACDAHALEAMSDFVRDMHTKNGLLAEVAQAVGRADDVVETIETDDDSLMDVTALAAYLGEVVDRFAWDGIDGKVCAPILAGSSVHFDFSFLEVDAGTFTERLHYRRLDVSSAMMLAKPMGVEFARAGAHRAMPDAVESLANLQICRDLIAAGVEVQRRTEEIMGGDESKAAEQVATAIDPRSQW